MSADTLDKKLRDWLETQGYPLEMRVARALQVAGFRTIQSDYYPDPAGGHFREVDVIATVQRNVGRVIVRVALVVECKASREKPWLLFVSNRSGLADPARVAQRVGTSLARKFLHAIASKDIAQSVPIFCLPNEPAYGFTQAFTSANDVCYASAMSVSTASVARVNEYERQEDRPRKLRVLEMVFPVIVTEARLFAAGLDESAKVSLTEQQSGILLWRNPLAGMPHTIIHVVSEPDLVSFSRMAFESSMRLLGFCTGELKAEFDTVCAGKRPSG